MRDTKLPHSRSTRFLPIKHGVGCRIPQHYTIVTRATPVPYSWKRADVLWIVDVVAYIIEIKVSCLGSCCEKADIQRNQALQ